MNKGFTIIEVLVSLVILSMIAIVSSNILNSSLDTEQETSLQLNSIKELNLASTIIKRDLRQIANVNLKDFYGSNINGTFISEINSQNLMFNSTIKSLSNEVSPIKRIQYELDDNNLIRKQYFSSNPYGQDDFVKIELIKNIDKLKFEIFFETKLQKNWPVSLINSNIITIVVKNEFTKKNKEYTWIIDPNITHAL